jgi:molybdopterin converting factor small subunit
MLMRVDVHLHTILQRQTQTGRLGRVAIDLPEGATVGDALDALAVREPVDSLILVINHRVADLNSPLKDGDRLDLVPAISGGCIPAL